MIIIEQLAHMAIRTSRLIPHMILINAGPGLGFREHTLSAGLQGQPLGALCKAPPARVCGAA